MNQECEKCQKRFRVQRLVNFPSSPDYPVNSEALYCPFCGTELAEEDEPEDLGDNDWAEGHPSDYED